ncbi:MAG: alpha/beta hydrolase [Eubacteriales bacterium]
MKQYKLKNGFCVRYQDLPGEGIPLVFLHGLGCASSFEYPAVMAEPALKGRRAILIDLLGAGYSDKPLNFGYTVEEHAAYLNEMLRGLHLTEFVLFGHSLGGAVAITLATLMQDVIRCLILTESNLDPSPDGATSRKIGSQSNETFLSHGYADLLSSAQKRNPLWGATLQSWLPEAAWRISRSAMKGGTPSWRDQLYALPMSRSFIFGAQSLPDEDEEVLRQHGVRVDVIPDAGHSMALENPKRLAQTIASILSDCGLGN